MKKIIYILSIFLLAGCSDWLDVNTDPNTPSDVDASLILPATETTIATRLGGNMFNFAGFFVQYWTQAPEANQWNKLDIFNINSQFLNRDYSEFYAGALNDLEVIRNKTQETEQWGEYLAATVLRAYAFQIWVDMMDQAPYSEALKGVENKNPKYDDGAAVYGGLIDEIDAALANISTASSVTVKDLIFGGNIRQWIGFANAMKLKLYMRASNAADYSSEIQALINEDNFFTEDVTFDVFANEVGKHNPWYETNKIGLGTVNNIASLPIVSYLKSKNDPRLPALWTDVDGDFNAGVPAMKEGLTADYSAPIIGATQPVYYYTLTELELFKSEAYVRFFNDDAKAKEAYEKAIDHNLALHGLGVSGSELYGEGKPYEWDSNASDKLKQIAMQKWVSLCLVNNLESWFEVRRLGYPEVSGLAATDIYNDNTLYTTPGEFISPKSNTLGGDNFLQRLPFPEESTRLNVNSPEQQPLTSNVWWDTK
jgi:hypothetical protein